MNINPSDKSRGQNILPIEDSGNLPAPGFKEKVIKYKWWIIAGSIVVIGSILAAVLIKEKDNNPNPPLPPVPPPTPGTYNPYSVIMGTNYEYKLTGSLRLNQDEADRLNAELIVNDGTIKANPRSIPTGPNNQMLQLIDFEFGQAHFKTAYLRTSTWKKRYSVPEEVVNKPDARDPLRLDMVGFEIFRNPFGFQFTDDKDPSNVYLTTKNCSFVMMDKYIQLDMQLPSRRIYGLGERAGPFTLGEGTWTMWANGQSPVTDNGTGGKQSYGVHPFALVQTAKKDEFMGLFFRNSNAMSPVIYYTGDNSATLSFISTGGQLEVYFMFKGSAKEIIKQYLDIVGKPHLPPFWSLGWHASSSAYTNQTELANNVQMYAEHGLPLEGVWLDYPWMSLTSDFFINATSFPSLQDFVSGLKNNSQRFMFQLDSGFKSNEKMTYNMYYNTALQAGLLLNTTVNPSIEGGVLTQRLRKNHTAYMDLFHKDATDLWAFGIGMLWRDVKFDGLWLDKNEATGDCDGECPPFSFQLKNSGFLELEDYQNNTWWQSYTDQTLNSTYDLPFIPGNKWNLDHLAISLNATHNSNNLTQYDTHNLFGLMIGKATHDAWARADDKRLFVVARGTYSGSGRYNQHFLGDNYRTWQDLKNSITGVMNFNMFGIPMTGPNTCGSLGLNIDDELCGRWMQLATFFPLARQHIDASSVPNEIWRLNQTQQDWAQNALYDRLQYVRQMYTCLYESFEKGQTCFDPLFFHYSDLDDLYDEQAIVSSIMVANQIKVSPVLQPNAALVHTYFPNGVWVNLKNYSDMLMINETKGGKWMDIPAPSGPNAKVNAHLKPGGIIAFQENNKKFNTTAAMMVNATLALIVNRNMPVNYAEGTLYIDKDGETLSDLKENKFEYYRFQLTAKTLSKQVLNNQTTVQNGLLNKVVITDALDLQDTDFACMTNFFNRSFTALKFEFDGLSKTLNISQIDGTPIVLNQLRDIHFGTKARDVNMCDLGSNYYKADAIPDLTLANFTIILTSKQTGVLRNLNLSVAVLEDGNLNVHWNYQDMNGVRIPFEVPQSIIKKSKINSTAKLSDWIQVKSINPIVIEALSETGQAIWTLNGMILGEFFNLIDTQVHTHFENATFTGIAGLAQQNSGSLFLPNGVFSLWSLDTATPIQTGKSPGKNTYSTDPFYMAKAVDKTWFGVYTNLASAQDWWIANNNVTGNVAVTTIAAGGLGDIFIMRGPGPNEITKQYHKVIGLPVLPPLWALGWHQSRQGYLNIREIEDVTANYTQYDLPLDSIWADLAYMDSYYDFTIDEVFWMNLEQWVNNTLHPQNKYFVPIVEAAIAIRTPDEYPVFADGQSNNIFIKDPSGTEEFIGSGWAMDMAYPDYFAQNTTAWWMKWVDHLQNITMFDGLWLTNNEASNFLCNGTCYARQNAMSPVGQKLPYIPTGRNLEEKSISLDALHANGEIELDVHSLYGTMQTQATKQWFDSKQKRPMIIGRSSFSGLGKFGQTWLGDNFSEAADMGYSTTGVMAANIGGIPLSGADICGDIGNSSAILCTRWYVNGAFYPFSRNHNMLGNSNQEPWAFDNDPPYEGNMTYRDIIQLAMRTKMELIRYYYTGLALSSQEGGAFYKPMYFEFPDDPLAYKEVRDNVMLGTSLKLSVLSTEVSRNETLFYFPKGVWCNIFNKGEGQAGCFNNSDGKFQNMSSKAYDFYLHLREGHIVPYQNLTVWQEIYGDVFLTTRDTQNYSTSFLINPSCNQTHCFAQGTYINDDGRTTNLTDRRNHYSIQFKQDLSTPDTWEFSISQELNATYYNDSRVNFNDVLASIEIHNAAALNLNYTYTSIADYRNGSSAKLNKAQYDPFVDKLVLPFYYSPGLPELVRITFTKSA